MTLKLDNSIRSQLGYSARSTKELGFYGLNGRAIHSAMSGFAKAESAEKQDRFGNPTGQIVGMIVDPGEFSNEALNDHCKGGFHSRPVKERKKAIVSGGKVITHRELKGRRVSSGVYFPVEEYEPEEHRVSAELDESVTREETGRWNGHRVDMNGTVSVRNRRAAKKRGK